MFFGQFLKWPTSPNLQQWTSAISGSLPYAIALTDLDLQCFAKCTPCNIRNISSEEVLCDLFTLVTQFYLLGCHGHLTLIEISVTNYVLPMHILLQPEMFLDFLSWPSCTGGHDLTYQWKTPLAVTLQLLYLLLQMHHLPKHTASLHKPVQTIFWLALSYVAW